MAIIQDKVLERMNNRVHTEGLVYNFSWGYENPFGIQNYSVCGTRDEILELLQFLADDERVVNPSLNIKRAYTPMANGHVHIKDGIQQNHNWEDCPENPSSLNYNPE